MNSQMTFETFIESVKIGNIDDVKSNFDFEYFQKEDKYGLKPIHWACLSSNIHILEWMLQEKCNIETSNRNGWRPIHFASFIGNEEIMQFLIGRFCELNCQTDNGETVLNIANGDFNRIFIDEILNENINLKIGLSMGLKCGGYCDHGFCLRSVNQCKFDKDELIQWGMFTIVHKVKDSQSDRQFAVKTIKRCYYDNLINEKCILPNINAILPNLNNSKIIKYYGLMKTETEMILFMELMNHGSLWKEIRSIGALILDKIDRYCYDILQAVAFLHRKKILHGNISSRNILIDNNGGCKLSISIFSCSLADGDVQIDKDLWRSNYINYPFVAPEIINNKPLSFPYDIWGVGCTVIDMLSGKYLRYPWDTLYLLDKITSEISNETLRSFIQIMLIRNPSDRAVADELLTHKFLGNVSIYTSNNQSNINDRNNSIKIKKYALKNKQIGLTMGLTCENECEHNFCLSSVAATDLKKGKIIGEGAYGKVYKIEFNYKRYWAMKIIKNVYENNEEDAKCFEDDINLYREFIIHDNIVKYFGAVRNATKIYIFMEFIDGESLYQKIKKNKCKPLPLTTIKQYTKQILEGLKFLHNSKIIHRDIKSANILIDKKESVKIVDFGVSRFLRTISCNQKKTFCGTANYMSPEIINDEPYGCSADIWSLGATVLEMATGHPPYHDMTPCFVVFKIGTTKVIEYPSNLSNDVTNFLKLMINIDPEYRSSAESLIDCEFLNRLYLIN